MSTLEDRLVAKGIRRGLELWPDANHWCQGQLTNRGANGARQVCTMRMLTEGLEVSLFSYGVVGSPLAIAYAEIMAIAHERGLPGAGGDLCDFNNSNDFETVKSVVEEAARRLERADA